MKMRTCHTSPQNEHTKSPDGQNVSYLCVIKKEATLFI